MMHQRLRDSRLYIDHVIEVTVHHMHIMNFNPGYEIY